MTYIEYIAAAFGILGTLLLALNGKRAGWGFVAFLASNAGWIVFAIANDHRGLLAQQLAFTATSLLGIWRWLLTPRPCAVDRSIAAMEMVERIGSAKWDEGIAAFVGDKSAERRAREQAEGLRASLHSILSDSTVADVTAGLTPEGHAAITAALGVGGDK